MIRGFGDINKGILFLYYSYTFHIEEKEDPNDKRTKSYAGGNKSGMAL